MSSGEDFEALLVDARAGRRPLEDALRALPSAEVLVVLADAGAGEEDDRARPVTTSDHEGNPLIPVFTSEGRIPGELGASRRLRNRMAALADGWPAGVGLLINAGSEEALVLPAADVPGLAGRHAVVEAPAGTRVALGEPAEEPVELLGRFREVAERTPEALALFRAQAVWRDEGGDVPRLLVALQLRPGSDADEVMARVMDEVGTTGGTFDAFAFDDPASSDTIVQFLLARTEPVWRSGGDGDRDGA